MQEAPRILGFTDNAIIRKIKELSGSSGPGPGKSGKFKSFAAEKLEFPCSFLNCKTYSEVVLNKCHNFY